MRDYHVKILHIQQNFNRNFGYQENIFPAYQKKIGEDVVLLTADYDDGFDGTDRYKGTDIFVENGFTVERIPTYYAWQGKHVHFKNLTKYIEREKPDYIFHHGPASPSLVTVANYKKKQPEVLLAVDSHFELNITGQVKWWKFLYYNLLWKMIIKFCDKQIDIYFGVTPARCLFLNEELGVSKEKIRLLPIGADTDAISKVNKDRYAFSAKYNLIPDAIYFVHGGKMTRKKKVLDLINAFKQISSEVNVQLLLFGSFEDKVLQEECLSDERIKYLGWQDRKSTLEILKNCDIGNWNTQHTTLLEDAIGCELPMVLKYYGSTSHLIDGNGMFIYEARVNELLEKMNLFTSDYDLRNSLVRNAKRMAKELSYYEVAKESIAYTSDPLLPQALDEKFMSSKFSDFNYKGFRKFQN